MSGDLAARHQAEDGAACAARGDWLSAIDAYTVANRNCPDRLTESELLRARREAFLALPQRGDGTLPSFDPTLAVPICPEVGLPVLRGAADAATVRATIAAHGSVMVKGLLGNAAVRDLRRAFDGAFAERDVARSGIPLPKADGWHTAFPQLRYPWHRDFTAETGGMLAVDSARGSFRCFEAFHEAGITQLVTEYLGCRPAFAAEKMVFRRISPELSPPPGFGWHQDGSFMGTDDRVLNIWIALTECGRTSPSLEVLPVRSDKILENHEGYLFSFTIEAAYPNVRTVLPVFEPGDALLFDDKCVHRTGHIEGMTETRLALECWTFAPGNVPRDYTGLLL